MTPTGDRLPQPERVGSLLYKVVDDERLLLAARRVHHDAYLRAPRITTIAEPLPGGVIDDPYVGRSIYLVGLKDEHSRRAENIHATLRLIPHAGDGLPALVHYRLRPWFRKQLGQFDLVHSCELSSFVSRGVEASRGLFRFAWRCSAVRGDTHWFACLHERTAEWFTRRFDFRFRKIGEKGEYMGETAPYVLVLDEQAEYFRDSRPEEYRYYVLD